MTPELDGRGTCVRLAPGWEKVRTLLRSSSRGYVGAKRVFNFLSVLRLKSSDKMPSRAQPSAAARTQRPTTHSHTSATPSRASPPSRPAPPRDYSCKHVGCRDEPGGCRCRPTCRRQSVGASPLVHRLARQRRRRGHVRRRWGRRHQSRLRPNHIRIAHGAVRRRAILTGCILAFRTVNPEPSKKARAAPEACPFVRVCVQCS